MSFLENTWLLGLVAFGIIWIMRKAGWAHESKQAMWLTFGVSVLLAIVQVTLQQAWPAFPVMSTGDPFVYAGWLGAVLGVIGAGFGQVLGASQIIYQTLRHLILGERV